MAGATLAIVLPLWALTLWASNVRWPVVTLVWTAIGSVLFAWNGLTERRDARRREAELQAAMQQNSANVVRVVSQSVVELEEREDEGACYAFQLPNEEIVFVVGQEFYESARFPNSDFSLVEITDNRGRVVEFFIAKDGVKLTPVRQVPAAARARLREPQHLELLKGRLDDLEGILLKTGQAQ
jgi:hypothetical protein